jgi:5,6,7,8-tetrahydromethanopterin hydro-lyase
MPAIAPSETERLAELEREFIRVLKITLSKLGAETDLADLYYSRLRTASPDERLLALHDNPLEVASVLAGVPLTKSAFDREDSVRDKSQGDRPTDRRLLSTAIITDLRVGESLVGDGYEVAHIDLIMGPRGTAAEKAFANCLTNNKDGFTSLLAVVAPNLMVKPATVMFNKVTIKNAKQAVQLFGPAQHAVAKAIADSVAEGVIPRDEAENLFICVGVFIHWEATDDKKIQDFNYRATKEAIARAVKGEPSATEVVAKRNQVKHPFAA